MPKKRKKISLIGSRITSVLSVTLVLIIIGLCFTLGLTVNKANDMIADGNTVLLTMVPGNDPLRSAELKRQFNDDPAISKYEFTDANTVLGRESDIMTDEDLEALQLLGENPFGDEFVLYINDNYRQLDSLAMLTARLEGLEGVDMVNNSTMAFNEEATGIDRIIIYAGITALILLVISVVLINNTISLSIYSRRFTIHTMKLVGATNSFIRRPFVRAGTLTGVIAGFIAAIVVCGTQLYLTFTDSLVGPWINTTLIILTGVGLIIVGSFLTRVAAWCATTNYLNKSYDRLFKK